MAVSGSFGHDYSTPGTCCCYNPLHELKLKIYVNGWGTLIPIEKVRLRSNNVSSYNSYFTSNTERERGKNVTICLVMVCIMLIVR